MMRCSRARKLLSPLIDKELSEKEARQVRDHLKHCVNCREVWQHIEQVDTLSRTTPAHEPSEAYWTNFLPRLHQRIEAAPRENVWTRTGEFLKTVFHPSSPWFRTAGAVASVILVFVIGWSLLRDTGTHDVFVAPMKHNMDKKMKHEILMEEAPKTPEKSDLAEQDTEEVPPPVSTGEEQLTIQPVEKKDQSAQPSDVYSFSDKGVASHMKRHQIAEGEKTIIAGKPSSGSHSAVSADETRMLYDQALQQQNTGENEAASAQYRYLLAKFPESPLADDAQFQLNVIKGSTQQEEQTLEGWQDQRDAWQQFLQTYPKSELQGQACLKLAESWYQVASLTLSAEDIQQALTINRRCQQTLDDENALNKRSIELEQMLNRSKK